MGFTPTAEQQAVIEAFDSGVNLIVQAGAGTGKTTTLREAAKTAEGDRGLYVAFNKSVQVEAEQTFPSSVRARTAHALAYAHMMRSERGQRLRDKMDVRGHVRIEDVASLVLPSNEAQVTYLTQSGDTKTLDGYALAQVAQATIRHWCQSADKDVGPNHIWVERDWYAANKDALRAELWDTLAMGIGRLRKDIFDPEGTVGRFSFEHFLKQWQLDDPVLRFDYIFLDEAQDASPVIADVFLKQEDHAQLVAVGDSMQAIYGWTGAVDALDKMKRSGIEYEELWLTESWRFGQPVADTANVILRHLPTKLSLTGRAGPSEVTPPEVELGEDDIPFFGAGDTVLVRTNAQGIQVAVSSLEKGLKPFIVMDTSYLLGFFRGAQKLMEGVRTGHPDLAEFRTWGEFLRFVSTSEDASSEFGTLVGLISSYGASSLIEVLEEADSIEEHEADVIVSTAHKAKGLEWDSVVLYGFTARPGNDEGMMLTYVAATRALSRLNPGVLWPEVHFGVPILGSDVANAADEDIEVLMSDDQAAPDDEVRDALLRIIPDDSKSETSAEFIRTRTLDRDKIREMGRLVREHRDTRLAAAAQQESADAAAAG